jgi:hypothetical protein
VNDDLPRKAKADAPHVTGRKATPSKLSRSMTAARERAKKVRSSAPRRVPVNIGIDLDCFDLMVELAERHGCRVPDVHRRALRDGLSRYGQLKQRGPFEDNQFGVFDRLPRGTDRIMAAEGEAPEPRELSDAVAMQRQERDRAAAELGLPGRRMRAVAE